MYKYLIMHCSKITLSSYSESRSQSPDNRDLSEVPSGFKWVSGLTEFKMKMA